jgi:hypothetical protein
MRHYGRYALAFFLFVLVVFDWVSPLPSITEQLEKAYPGSIRLCVFVSYQWQAGESTSTRSYFLIPYTLKTFRAVIVSHSSTGQLFITTSPLLFLLVAGVFALYFWRLARTPSTKLYKMALCILQHNYLKYIGC